MAHPASIAPTAFRNLNADASADLTRRYEALCAHYRMTPTRNSASVAHENGAVEGPHGHLKRAIADAPMLRASTAFPYLATPSAGPVRSHLEALRRCLEAEIRALDASIAAAIAAAEDLARAQKTLRSIPGVGATTAARP